MAGDNEKRRGDSREANDTEKAPKKHSEVLLPALLGNYDGQTDRPSNQPNNRRT